MSAPCSPPRKIKLVTSDMHLSSGRFVDGQQNPYEDFFFDTEFCEFLDYFSTGVYGDGCEVELVLNGDVLDFLNVQIGGEFVDVVTSAIAVEKLVAILQGHPEVVSALQRFVNRPGKRVVYNTGNHDMEFFFPEVRETFCRVIGGENWTRDKVWVNAEQEYLEYPEGIQIHHGNQFEAVHSTNYKQPFVTENLPEPILYMPWGSVYVTKIINRMKWERDYLDKVKPVKLFMLLSLIFDPIFTIKFFLMNAFYFLNTRFIYNPKRRATIGNTLAIMGEEITPFYGLEDDARALLNQHEPVKIIIFGHTHGAMQRFYRDGKTYINTGTWTRMISLDFRTLGQSTNLTFALIEYTPEDQPIASLREWRGVHQPHRPFNF
jgi:UDP-2,3-diacylglucosamine pyrophosphatase LpxH